MTSSTHRSVFLLVVALVVLMGPSARLFAQLPPPPLVVPSLPQPKKESPPIPGAMEVRFADKSMLKVVLKDDRIEFDTAYGKLSIPVSDIQKIEFAVRISPDETKKIEAAIADLGGLDPKRWDSAAAELLAFKEKAYPALVEQAKHKDAQTALRAEKVLEKLRLAIPTEALEASKFDVVFTPTSKLAGHFRTESLRVKTFAFGEQQMRLADVRSMQAEAFIRGEVPRPPVPPFPSITVTPAGLPGLPPANIPPKPPVIPVR